jgi:hypothetical protein
MTRYIPKNLDLNSHGSYYAEYYFLGCEDIKSGGGGSSSDYRRTQTVENLTQL